MNDAEIAEIASLMLSLRAPLHELTPWQNEPCALCGKPSAGVIAGPSGFCDLKRVVLCKAHYAERRT